MPADVPVDLATVLRAEIADAGRPEHAAEVQACPEDLLSTPTIRACGPKYDFHICSEPPCETPNSTTVTGLFR